MTTGADSLKDRVSGLEGDVRKLTHTVGGLESDMKNVIRSVEQLTDNIQSLGNAIRSENKTNWGTLAAWASAVIGIISVIGYLAMTPLQSKLATLEDRTYDHVLKDGHIGMQRDTEWLKKEVEKIRQEQLRRTQKVYQK